MENTKEKQENTKKSKKGKIIAIIAAAVVIIAAFMLWFTGIVGGISEAEAKNIALQQVPDADQSEPVIVNGEFDDMQKVYEVQLSYDNMWYEFTILARNGKIVSQDMEKIATESQAQSQTSQSSQSTSDIGLEKAMEIALAEVPGAAETDITKAKTDNENGTLIYEIEIVYDNVEYDFDINAATGNIDSRSSESVHN